MRKSKNYGFCVLWKRNILKSNMVDEQGEPLDKHFGNGSSIYDRVQKFFHVRTDRHVFNSLGFMARDNHCSIIAVLLSYWLWWVSWWLLSKIQAPTKIRSQLRTSIEF